MRRTVLFGLSLLVAAACLGLAGWQLRRLSTRRAANREALLQRTLPVLAIDSGLPILQANRKVRVVGELDEAREFGLRGRVIQGVPAILIVTPLRLAGSDTALLVNRGYVPAPDAVNPGAVTWSESGEHRFQGVLLPVPDRGDGSPVRYNGRETWKALDLSAMRARLPYPVAALYLIAEPDSADGAAHTIRGRSYPFRAEPPPLDEGPHLMYAVQWLGIAAAVLVFGIIFVWRGGPRKGTVD